MNFALTKEQENIQKMMRNIVEKEIAPGTKMRDNEPDPKKSFDTAHDILRNKMAPMGLLSLWFPKEYGGLDVGVVSLVAAALELNKQEVGFGTAYGVHMGLAAYAIPTYGTKEQKEKWLHGIAKGETLCSFGLTEPNAGSDAAMQQTTAVKDGDEYVLNGSKIYITNSGYSDLYMVYAMTDQSKGTKGISCFVVEKDTPGLTIGPASNKMGIRASIQCELYFDNMRVPAFNRIGEEGEGFKIAMNSLNLGRIAVAAQGAGNAWGALEDARKYAKERIQFGKPIIKQQMVQAMLADMAVKVETAIMLTYKAAWLADEGLPYAKEASMAKRYATDIGMEVTTDAVQCYGGAGFLKDHDVERRMRDAKILQIYEGTNQIQRGIIAGFLEREE